LGTRFWIPFGVLSSCAVAACAIAIVIDPGSLAVADPQPWAPEPSPGPPETAAVALDRTVPGCPLYDLEGRALSSAALRGPTPVVFEFGSFTCKFATGQAEPMDRLADKYRGRVRFVFIYTDEAHPGIAQLPDGYSGPRDSFSAIPTPADRQTAARILRDALAVRRDILVEPVGGPGLREGCGLGTWRGHPGLVADPDGRVVYAANWLKADALDAFLTVLLDRPDECRPVADDSAP
jgi:hypothetical protein